MFYLHFWRTVSVKLSQPKQLEKREEEFENAALFLPLRLLSALIKTNKTLFKLEEFENGGLTLQCGRKHLETKLFKTMTSR